VDCSKVNQPAKCSINGDKGTLSPQSTTGQLHNLEKLQLLIPCLEQSKYSTSMVIIIISSESLFLIHTIRKTDNRG
jgi:hypothetical protein